MPHIQYYITSMDKAIEMRSALTYHFWWKWYFCCVVRVSTPDLDSLTVLPMFRIQ